MSKSSTTKAPAASVSDGGQDGNDFDERFVCFGCIGEKYLRREIRKTGIKANCHYCGCEGKSWSLDQLAGRVAKAFEHHFERTATEPEGMEATMHYDKESTYEWHRSGEESANAIADAAGVDEELAEDIRVMLSDAQPYQDPSDLIEEQEFDTDARYVRKSSRGLHYHDLWVQFEKCVRTESRYFSPTIRTTLDRVFDGVDLHKTVSGRRVLVQVGPGQHIERIYRARVFSSEKSLLEAIERPDEHLGPPPSEFARPGRMNPAGISVFYGARSGKVALAEVRPPVGSTAAVSCFIVIRTLTLLDLDALREIVVRGSIFDPSLEDRMARAEFLGILSHQLSRAVMPDDEVAGYLVTQVVADYLANIAKIDGIIFPSVQTGTKRSNVVLFHGASRVEPRALPRGTKIDSSAGFSSEEGFERDYYVWESIPADPKEPPSGPGIANFGTGELETWSAHASLDTRIASLRVDLDSLKVIDVIGARYRERVFEIHRSQVRQADPDAPSAF